MNDEAMNLLLVHTHQDGTATPARVFNRGAASVFQHWRRDGRRTKRPTATTLRVFCRSCATISHRVPERELEANVTQTSIKIPQVDFD
jgi:hypothetical protein